MTNSYKIILAILLAIALIQVTEAKMFRVVQIPNGNKFQCSNCHIKPDGGSKLTPFGNDVKKYLSNSNVQWGPELAKLDSDNDGFTNGQELLDPDGTWSIGQANPGDPNNVGNPGDSKSTPIINSLIEIAETAVTVYPNPTANSFNLKFHLANLSFVRIDLLNITGQHIKTLYSKITDAGEFNMTINTFDINKDKLSPGAYLLTISYPGQMISKKIIIN